MALSRVTTWVAGQVLTAAALNGEFNNVLNNPISLVSPTTGAINFNLQAHTGLVPGAISATSGFAGQALIQTSSNTVATFGGPAAGSRVKGLNGIISSQSGTFSADMYLMQTSGATQSWVVTATSSYSANVGTVGPAAGGRDQAGAFASTYVHWYAITTGAGSTAPAGLVSTQPPNVGPTLPTGYAGFTYLGGSIYSSASTTVTNAHRAKGAWWSYDGPVAILSAGASTAETAIPLTGAVPINALNYQVETFHQDTATANSFKTAALRVITAVDYSISTVTIQSSGGSETDGSRAHITLPTTSLAYQITASGTNPQFTVSVQRYQNPNGDV